MAAEALLQQVTPIAPTKTAPAHLAEQQAWLTEQVGHSTMAPLPTAPAATTPPLAATLTRASSKRATTRLRVVQRVRRHEHLRLARERRPRVPPPPPPRLSPRAGPTAQVRAAPTRSPARWWCAMEPTSRII